MPFISSKASFSNSWQGIPAKLLKPLTFFITHCDTSSSNLFPLFKHSSRFPPAILPNLKYIAPSKQQPSQLNPQFPHILPIYHLPSLLVSPFNVQAISRFLGSSACSYTLDKNPSPLIQSILARLDNILIS